MALHCKLGEKMCLCEGMLQIVMDSLQHLSDTRDQQYKFVVMVCQSTFCKTFFAQGRSPCPRPCQDRFVCSMPLYSRQSQSVYPSHSFPCLSTGALLKPYTAPMTPMAYKLHLSESATMRSPVFLVLSMLLAITNLMTAHIVMSSGCHWILVSSHGCCSRNCAQMPIADYLRLLVTP